MSARNDNLFARWSRRKQAVRDSETPPPDAEERALDAAAAATNAESVDQQPAAETDAAEPAEPLPRLEDLTADSDLSAFLREGVPKALKSAALRKMWSLDPAIRDYIGPSEYAWDFNQPGSMAGFGPLDADEHIAEFLSTMSGGVRAGLAKTAASPEASLTSQPEQDAEVQSEQDASASPDSPADAVSPNESLERPQAPAGESLSSDPVAAAIEPAEAARPVASAPSLPRHGRAMPR